MKRAAPTLGNAAQLTFKVWWSVPADANVVDYVDAGSRNGQRQRGTRDLDLTGVEPTCVRAGTNRRESAIVRLTKLIGAGPRD